jgi:hypothetical protein
MPAMARRFRWLIPPFAAAIGFVAVITVGGLALMWTVAAARPMTVGPWVVVVIAAVFVAAALVARRAIFNRGARRGSTAPGEPPHAPR